MSVQTDVRLPLLRVTTKALIDDLPTTITIKRRVAVRKPSGGHDFPTVDLPPQRVRIVNQSTDSGISYSGSDDGQTRQFDYMIIAEWDADLDVEDSWSDGEKQYKIDAILPDNGFERRAIVTAFAVEPDNG